MTKFDVSRTLAAIAFTIVCSSVAVLGAVGPANAGTAAPAAIHATA